MTEQDKQRFKIAMHLFEITFNADFDNAKLAGYFMALQDMPIECIESAVKECCKREKRTPPPAVIREYGNQFRPAIQAPKQIQSFSLRDLKPQSALGQQCVANILALADGKIDKREFLLEAHRIADRHHLSAEHWAWIDEQWEECCGET